MLSIQKFPDPLGHKGRLFLVGTFLHGNGPQFHLRFSQRFVGEALPEGLFLTVVKAAHPMGHTSGKYIIHTGKHRSAAAEIMGQQYFSALTFPGLLGRDESIILFQENAGVSQAELVNGLLHIANHKAILPLLGQRHEDGILHRIGILIFVHHDLPETAGNFHGDGGSAAALFAQQQIQCPLLQIAEIQDPSAALYPVKFRFKSLSQRNDTTDRSSRICQIRQNSLTIVLEYL